MGVNWTAQKSATSTAIDNTSFEFYHPLMTAVSTTKRRYVPSKRKRVPDNLILRSPKKLNATLDPNFPASKIQDPKENCCRLDHNSKGKVTILG